MTVRELKIEKGIPIPEIKPKHLGISKTLRKMEIGDSILLVADEVISLTRISKDAKVKVTRRKEGDNYRVWRIA